MNAKQAKPARRIKMFIRFPLPGSYFLTIEETAHHTNFVSGNSSTWGRLVKPDAWHLENAHRQEHVRIFSPISSELNIVLVRARDRILPEPSESLARYAQGKMETRGVSFRLNARLSDAQPGVVVLTAGEVRAQTLLWTAGTDPNPLVKAPLLRGTSAAGSEVGSALAISPLSPSLFLVAP